METEGFKRKLTAILSADVEGYSRLMGEDEDATIRTLTAYRELMTTLIQKHRGRVVDSPGDNLLAEFLSVVDAVRCAVEIQEELRVRNAELPENRRMHFRIGINLGDVVQEEERIYGDGINIAARVEGLAEGGGICISGTVYDSIKNKLSLSYEPLGEHTVKNIKEPVRVYRMRVGPEAAVQPKPRHWHKTALAALVVLIVAAGAWATWNFYFRPPPIEPASVEKMAFPLPEKPSIAVLPFANLSGDPEQEYFCDGMTDQIITALSKVPRMFVIARNSTFTYKGKPVKVQAVAEELGVRYVLEGSIQKSGDRVRITAQLIDALSGNHLWAERYDRDLKDIFAMQDEITMKIMTALRVKLTEGEEARIYARGTNNLEAYLKVMKGYKHVMRFNKDDVHLGRQLYKEAIALDPNYSNAYTLLAWTHRHDVRFGWTKTPEKSIKKCIEVVKKALSINEYDAMAHMCLSNIYSMMREFEKAIAEGEKCIALEPNGASVNATFAIILTYAGRYDQAIEKLEKAERLNPIRPGWYFWIKAVAFHFAGKYEKAIESAKKGLKKMPNHTSILRILAASYILLGRMEEASAVTEKILELQPKFSLDQEAKRLEHIFKNKADVERHIDALRKSDLPDKPPLPLPDKPSIAVLPFTNMSEDPKQEYFSDGITEEIITALSKTPKLFVIARNSTFTYKGKPTKVQQVGRELGVKYVLEGSVRKAGNKVRITAQLVDAQTGHHLWAERYDRDLKDVFAIQDEITMEIIKALQIELTEGELAHSMGSRTDNLQAYLLFLQGSEHFRRTNKDGMVLARQMAERAIELDPEYAEAYVLLANSYWVEVMLGLTDNPRQSISRAMKTLQKALTLDQSSASAHSLLGWLYILMRQHDKGIAECEKAVSLEPNSSKVHFFLSLALRYAGKAEEAIIECKEAIRLNPIPPSAYYQALTNSYCLTGKYNEAIGAGKEAVGIEPNNMTARAFLAAAYSLGGMEEEALAEAKEVLRINPRFSVVRWAKTMPYKNEVDRELTINALRKAGLPE